MNNFAKNTRAIFVILGTLYVSLAIIGGFRFYSPVPWVDGWDGYLDFFMAVSDGDWSAWWAQHNEHRILLSRLLFWLDFILFGGKSIFLIVINYLLATLGFIVLYLCLKERLQPECIADTNATFTRQMLAFFMLALCFAWMQRVNLLWAFQSQIFLAQLLPLTAFYLLHKSHTSTSHSTQLFYFACLAGAASLGTMANGILALPLMVLLGCLLRITRQRIAILIALSALGAFAYFYDYYTPGIRGNPTAILFTAPLDFLHYILLFLGCPFYNLTSINSELTAEVAGLFMIGSTIFFAMQSLRMAKTSSLSLALLVFILYIIASAVAAASGRVYSAGVSQALTARYTTATTMAWLSLLILYAPAIHKRAATHGVSILWSFIFILLLHLPLQFHAFRSVSDRNLNFKVAALALTLGIKDTTTIHSVYGDVEHVMAIAARATDNKLSIFAIPPFSEARQTLGLIANKRTSVTCSGGLHELSIITDDSRYYQVRGWLQANHSEDSPEAIHLLDEQGIVVGLALSGFTHNNTRLGFAGYIQANQLNKQIILRGLNPDCELPVLAQLTETNPLPEQITNQ